MSQDGTPLHPGWGDATSENRISKLKFPLTWLSGPEWGRRPVLSALFGDTHAKSWVTLYCHVQLNSSERLEEFLHLEATKPWLFLEQRFLSMFLP